MRQLIPDKIQKKKKAEIKTLQISYGNEKKSISDFFSISGALKNGIIFKGNLSKCDYIGNQMKNGEIIIQGNVRDKVMGILEKEGYKYKRVGG